MISSRVKTKDYEQSAIQNAMNIENIVMIIMKHLEMKQILALDNP